MLYNKNISLISILAITLFIHTTIQAQIKKANDPIYQHLDTTVKPGDNFFRYANGTWLKQNPIPAANASWGIGNVVNDDLRERLRKINEDAQKAKAAKGTSTQ